jgi:dTMP kinase
MQLGKLISFEGGEGVGKTTQIQRLAARLAQENIPTQLTREPGGTVIAEKIRSLLLDPSISEWEPTAELLLHIASRVEHVQRRIRPVRAQGVTVISDRFIDSTLVYQGDGQGIDKTRIWQLYDLALGERYLPDLTLVLLLPQVTSEQRTQARRTTDRYEQLTGSFHARVHEGFARLPLEFPERCVAIDASGSIDEIHARIWDKVGPLFAAN